MKRTKNHQDTYTKDSNLSGSTNTLVIDIDNQPELAEPIYETIENVKRFDEVNSQNRDVQSRINEFKGASAYCNKGFEYDQCEEASENIYTPWPKKAVGEDLPIEEQTILQRYLENSSGSRPSTIVKPWDVFRIVDTEEERGGGSNCLGLCKKITKAVVICAFFIIILGCAVLSKSSLLFIASQVRHDIQLTCDIDDTGKILDCYRLPLSGQSNITTKYTTTYNVQSKSSFEQYRNGKEISPKSNRITHIEMCESITMRWAWSLLLVLTTPYILDLIRSLWRIIFKGTKSPKPGTVAFVCLVETIHTIGVTLFVFKVLPTLNILRGMILMMGCGFIPSLLKVFNRPDYEKHQCFQLVLDIATLVLQMSIIIIWPITITFDGSKEKLADMAPIAISLLLISVQWWENFVDKDSKLFGIGSWLLKMRKQIHCSRSKVYAIASFWKIALSIILMIGWLVGLQSYTIEQLFDFSLDGKTCNGVSDGGTEITLTDFSHLQTDWVWMWMIQSGASLVCYLLARVACKIHIQVPAFSLPLILSPLITFCLMIAACEAWNTNYLVFDNIIPSYLYWNCYEKGGLIDAVVKDSIYVVIFWWMSYLCLTRHIWFPRAERLASTNKLFVKSFFCGIFLEQSITMNRRRNDLEFSKEKKVRNYGIDGPEFQVDFYNSLENEQELPHEKNKTVPMIYLCATMWHETEQEMTNLLKSVFRMDIDQSARKCAQQYLDVMDPDYYEFEAHIFFDDAFQAHGIDQFEYHANDFVKQLVRVMDIAASAVHKVNVKIPSPVKVSTPYGGRLEWTMPGGNKIIAHLKDKTFIRHKKRWSQVMYMYYFLGHRLWAQTDNAKHKQELSDNTFVLALDGDVDFQPSAIQLLVDLMKKDDKVGAACGRIHPIGSGPMVWYQKFEYAIGHWFQKSTEHMIGCVLCSPGCFSLFRGSALMDDNVMRKYATVSTEASHYVQFDQGEDRWLCTLLLQQGYRVEYCAASDAYTFAPEGFSEFYNQRRRWTPSTMANILDLLMDWKHTCKTNKNISLPYIIYQSCMVLSGILGPGTIFLMIVGALQTAFGQFGISLWTAFIVNLVPLVLFVIGCYTLKSNHQLTFASILSAVYSIVMILVVIGIALQISEEGLCSPSALFLLFVTAFFIAAGIFHPQEFFCLVPGALYFLLIPSMYLFLIIYAMCNLNVVSWGTREVAQAAPSNKSSQREKSKDAKEKQKQSILQQINLDALKKKEGGLICNLGSMFKCVLCPKDVEDEKGSQLEILLKKMEDVEDAVNNKSSEKNGLIHSSSMQPNEKESAAMECDEAAEDKGCKEVSNGENTMQEVTKEENCLMWLQDEDLKFGAVIKLDENENEFWEGVIHKYLFPLESNKDNEKKVANELKDLRNNITFAFFLVNILYVTVIFTLQLQKESGNLVVKIPCFDPNRPALEIEPIAFTFLVFFGVVMLIQFIAMMFHRLGTLWHIVATTKIGCNKFTRGDLISMNIESSLELARKLQTLQGIDEDDKKSVASAVTESDEINEYQTVKFSREKSVMKLAKKRNRKGAKTGSLHAAFAKRLVALNDHVTDNNSEDKTEAPIKITRAASKIKTSLQEMKMRRQVIFEDEKASVEVTLDQPCDEAGSREKRNSKGSNYMSQDGSIEMNAMEVMMSDNDLSEVESEDEIIGELKTKEIIKKPLGRSHSSGEGETSTTIKDQHNLSFSLNNLDAAQGKELKSELRKRSNCSTQSTPIVPTSILQFDWAQTRERAASNLAAVKAMIELAEKSQSKTNLASETSKL